MRTTELHNGTVLLQTAQTVVSCFLNAFNPSFFSFFFKKLDWKFFV